MASDYLSTQASQPVSRQNTAQQQRPEPYQRGTEHRLLTQRGAQLGQSGEKNVGEHERMLSLLAGAALLTAGLTRMPLRTLVFAGLGAALAYRGATGHCQLYQRLGINSASRREEEDDLALSEQFGEQRSC